MKNSRPTTPIRLNKPNTSINSLPRWQIDLMKNSTSGPILVSPSTPLCSLHPCLYPDSGYTFQIQIKNVASSHGPSNTCSSSTTLSMTLCPFCLPLILWFTLSVLLSATLILQYIILMVQMSTAVCMLVAGNTRLDTLLLPPACSLSHSGSFHWSFCQQHSYILHYIILIVQTSTAVHVLIAGNTRLDAQHFLCLLPLT